MYANPDPMEFNNESHNLLAGVIGCFLALINLRTRSWWVILTVITSGAALAWYVPPPVAEYFGLSSNAQSVLALFLGMAGMSVVGAVVNDPLSILKFFKR